MKLDKLKCLGESTHIDILIRCFYTKLKRTVIDWVVFALQRELDGEITMDIEQALEILKSSRVDLGDEANDALDLMCDFVHDTLQRDKREYAACEEYTRRKEEGI